MITDAIFRADTTVSALPPELLHMHGMSSPRVRILLNELCAAPDCRYLEVGAFKGATVLSASYARSGSFTAIDNFSEFGGTRRALLANQERWSEHCRFQFIESDCWTVSMAAVSPINVFFYDGGHTESEQYRAFTHFDAALAPDFIAIVDDWNAAHVRRGTWRAFRDLQYVVAEESHLYSRYNGDMEGWWNGLYVARVRKPE